MSTHHPLKLREVRANHKRLVLSALFLIAALATSVLAMRGPKFLAPSFFAPSKPVAIMAEDTSTKPQRERREEPVQVVRFTLYDVGIVPELAYARAGLVTIGLEDLSGSTMGLVIERAQEGELRVRAGEVRRKERKRHGQEELRLEAGHYQLYMADRPDNRAELIVEP